MTCATREKRRRRSGSFAGNSAIYAASSILQKASSLILLPIYTRIMSPEMFGYLNLFSSFTTFAVVIALGGLEYSVVRYCSVSTTQADRARHFSAAWWTVVATGLALAALLLASGPLYTAWAFPGLSAPSAVVFLLIGIAAQPPFFIYLALLQAEEAAWEYGGLSIAFFLLNATFTIAGVAGLGLGELGLAASYAVCCVAFSCFALVASIRRKALVWRLSGLPFRKMGRYSLPLLPHNVAQQATLYFSRMSVAQFVSVAALGLFNVASYMVNIVDAVQNAMHRAFLPWFYREASQSTSDLKERVSDRVAAFVAVNAVISLAVALFADVVLTVLTHADYWGASEVVPVLALSMMVKGLYYPNLSVLLYDQRGTKYVLIISVTSGVVGVGLCYLLAPVLGVMGAAIGQLVQRAWMAGAAAILASRVRASMIPWRRVLRVQVPAVAILAAGAWLSHVEPFQSSLLLTTISKVALFVVLLAGVLAAEPPIRQILWRFTRAHSH